MLNDSYVLDYIKTNLAFPFNYIEIEDDKILDYIKQFTLKEFSHYYPQVYKIPVNLDLPQNKVVGSPNEFYIFDPDNIEILGVKELYFDISNLIALGYPPLGVYTYGQLPSWTLQVEGAISTKMFSDYDITFEFRHPNIVRISPAKMATGTITVEYERMQPPDFSGIPNEFQMIFCEFALAEIMIMIGRIRKKFGDGQIRTPFGEIPLGSEIFDEGKEKKQTLIEKFETMFIPNTIIDIG